MSKPETYTLKLTHAIVVAGEVITPGNLVDLPESEAKDLLRRGKAVLADERDAEADDGTGSEDGGDADEQPPATAGKRGKTVSK